MSAPLYRCPIHGHASSFYLANAPASTRVATTPARISAHGNLLAPPKGRYLLQCSDCGDQFMADVDPHMTTDA